MFRITTTRSPPLRGRGLKPLGFGVPYYYHQVAPFAGAWIETPRKRGNDGRRLVAPFAGAWIETPRKRGNDGRRLVAPFAGAWIETTRARAIRGKPPVAPFAGAWMKLCGIIWEEVGRNPLSSPPPKPQGCDPENDVSGGTTVLPVGSRGPVPEAISPFARKCAIHLVAIVLETSKATATSFTVVPF